MSAQTAAGTRIDGAAEAAVAVIVVHGVADQPRGDTVEAVAQQIAGASGAAVQRADVPVAVRACESAVPFKPWQTEGLRNLWSAILKSLYQSFGSDFLDPRLGGSDSRRAVGKARAPTEPLPNSAVARSADGADPDVRFTDFLLAKAQGAWPESGPPTAINNVACCRVSGSGGAKVDLFEMYWADLSRLSGSAPRIVTELFTLLFDLVRVGRNAVAMHGALYPSEPDAMRTLGRMHHLADWMYTRLLAMLTLQMLLCAIIVALACTLEGHERGVAYLVAAVAGVGAAVATVNLRLGKPWSWATGALVGLVCASALAHGAFLAAEARLSPLVGLLLAPAMLVLAWLYWRVLRFWEERFRAIMGFGLIFGAVTFICVAWGAYAQGGLYSINGWVAGALRAVELALMLQLPIWGVLAVLCAVIVVQGWRAGRVHMASDAASTRRQVIRTGRLGLFGSLGVFVVFTMALWALLNQPLQEAVSWVQYRPIYFERVALHPPLYQPFFDPSCSGVNAACFLERRFGRSTEMFALVALVLSLVLGFVLIVLLPCVLVELGWFRTATAARIGPWLTSGYCALEAQLRWWSWLAGGVMLGAAVLLVAPQLQRAGWPVPAGIVAVSSTLQGGSVHLLELIVLALAGSATGLLAIGRVGFKRVQALRTPLDAALDVDVHFREFPRKAIPRVRIAERYVALLEFVLDRGYERIVIVAHSQGSVITADLLRYLQQRAKLFDDDPRAGDDRLVQLGQRLAEEARVDLLTVGCPLRQLYATRFPSLYRWVLEPLDDASGPLPQELGLFRWYNLWGAADYVGRWLWSDGPRTDPSSLSVDAAAYDGLPLTGRGWRDQCVGEMAHTHYFELDQAEVRAALGYLIVTAP